MGVEVTIRFDGEIGDYVQSVTDGGGWYADVEEYLRDLIRRDIARDNESYAAYKAELRRAFAVPEADYAAVYAEDVITRNRLRRFE